MEKLPVSELKTGDVVLVETTVKRWVQRRPAAPATPQSAGTPGTPPSSQGTPQSSPTRFRGAAFAARTWNSWEMSLDLEAVSLLFKGSEYYQDPEPASEDVEF